MTVTTGGDWATAIERQRQRKDRFLADHPQSPLPPDHREGFDGLAYYPPDPALRFELPLDERDEPSTVTLETTTDGVREYVRWGTFEFEVDGDPCTLDAYKADPAEDRLWVPFRDATSGEETYGGGRYLDLTADDHRTGDGQWGLDFNLAYNPFCAYSDRYECALVPRENWLAVPIRAGEQAYEPAEESASHVD